jgi:hypothetical protein
MTRKHTREDFCPLCIAPIVAIAGGGLAGAGLLTEEEKNKKRKQLFIWTGVSIIVSVLMWYIWIRWKGGCKTCTLTLP